MKDLREAVQHPVSTSAVGAALLYPLPVRNNPTVPVQRQNAGMLNSGYSSRFLVVVAAQLFFHLPGAFIVLAASPRKVLRAGAETSQDAGAPVLTAAAALLRTFRKYIIK